MEVTEDLFKCLLSWTYNAEISRFIGAARRPIMELISIEAGHRGPRTSCTSSAWSIPWFVVRLWIKCPNVFWGLVAINWSNWETFLVCVSFVLRSRDNQSRSVSRSKVASLTIKPAKRSSRLGIGVCLNDMFFTLTTTWHNPVIYLAFYLVAFVLNMHPLIDRLTWLTSMNAN